MTWQVLSKPNVIWFLIGSGLSNVGTWVYNLAVAVLIYRLTGSTFLVGAVVFAQFAGTLFLAPWAGAAADRFDRRRILMVLQFSSSVPAALLGGAVALDVVTPWLVIAATALVGLASTFSSPSRHALIPLLVDSEDLETVVAFHAVTFQVARAVGPLIGAAVIALWGLPIAIGINSLSFLAFVATLARVRPSPQQRVAKGLQRSFMTTTAEAWRNRDLRNLLVSLVVVSLASDPATTLAPEYADVLGADDTAAGLLMGAFGVGSMVSGVLVAPRLGKRRHGLEAAMAAEFLGVLMFALSTDLLLALTGLAIAGAGFVCAGTLATAGLQRLAPPSAVGRIMALWGIAFLGARPVAALLDGSVAELLGVRVAATVVALPVIVFAALQYRSSRKEHDLQRLEVPGGRHRGS